MRVKYTTTFTASFLLCIAFSIIGTMGGIIFVDSMIDEIPKCAKPARGTLVLDGEEYTMQRIYKPTSTRMEE